tara:strand:- start:464 stop:886 length:423 start_codon:yes stop_codon:yes gene_type:complete
MFEWFVDNQSLLIWLSFFSAIFFIISLIALPWLVGLIPEDYFFNTPINRQNDNEDNFFYKLVMKIGKNALGLVLLAGGVLMLFLPGQGLLTLFMGMVLIDYPKKKLIERRLIKIGFILKGLNWVRIRGGHSSLGLNKDSD